MSEPITISFVGTTDIKTCLERWAEQDDRSVSYLLRKILEGEVQRREQLIEKSGEQRFSGSTKN